MTSATVKPAVELEMPVSMHADLNTAFRRCGPSFFRYFAVRLGSEADAADDLMQQLWLAAASKSDSRREANPEPWLWRIAENLLRAHWRRRSGLPDQRIAVDPELARALARQFDDEEIPLEVLARRETQTQLLLALTSLAADEQELIIGHYFECRSHADLAATRDISERAVEGRLYRARRSLRERLLQTEVED